MIFDKIEPVKFRLIKPWLTNDMQKLDIGTVITPLTIDQEWLKSGDVIITVRCIDELKQEIKFATTMTPRELFSAGFALTRFDFRRHPLLGNVIELIEENKISSTMINKPAYTKPIETRCRLLVRIKTDDGVYLEPGTDVTVQTVTHHLVGNRVAITICFVDDFGNSQKVETLAKIDRLVQNGYFPYRIHSDEIDHTYDLRKHPEVDRIFNVLDAENNPIKTRKPVDILPFIDRNTKIQKIDCGKIITDGIARIETSHLTILSGYLNWVGCFTELTLTVMDDDYDIDTIVAYAEVASRSDADTDESFVIANIKKHFTSNTAFEVIDKHMRGKND